MDHARANAAAGPRVRARSRCRSDARCQAAGRGDRKGAAALLATRRDVPESFGPHHARRHADGAEGQWAFPGGGADFGHRREYPRRGERGTQDLPGAGARAGDATSAAWANPSATTAARPPAISRRMRMPRSTGWRIAATSTMHISESWVIRKAA